MQGRTVDAGVRGLLAGVVVQGGVDRLCGHERNKNIVAGPASRLAWAGWRDVAEVGPGGVAGLFRVGAQCFVAVRDALG